MSLLIDDSYFDVIDKKPYQILKVGFDITLKELVQVYRKYSKLYHPDRWNGNQEHFILVNKCYRSIHNDIKNVRPNFIYQKNQQQQIEQRMEEHKSADVTDQNQFNLQEYVERLNKLKRDKKINNAEYNRIFNEIRKKYKIVTDRGYDLTDKKTFENKERAVAIYRKIQPVKSSKDKTLYFPLDGKEIDDFGEVGADFSDIVDAYRKRDIAKEASMYSYRQDYNDHNAYIAARNNMNTIEKKDYSNEYTIMYNQNNNNNMREHPMISQRNNTWERNPYQ